MINKLIEALEGHKRDKINHSYHEGVNDALDRAIALVKEHSVPEIEKAYREGVTDARHGYSRDCNIDEMWAASNSNNGMEV
jgi:hypothetical protein